jgi:hypothetical protein
MINIREQENQVHWLHKIPSWEDSRGTAMSKARHVHFSDMSLNIFHGKIKELAVGKHLTEFIKVVLSKRCQILTNGCNGVEHDGFWSAERRNEAEEIPGFRQKLSRLQFLLTI